MNFAFLCPCIKVTGIFVSPPTFTVTISACTVVQAVAQANGQGNGKCSDFDPTPTSRKPLTDFDETWTLQLPPENAPCKIWFRSDDVGGLGEWSVCHCKVSLSFFLFWSHHHAHRSHQWTDFDDLFVIRCLSTQRCAFWGFCWYHSPFRGPRALKTQNGHK